MPRAGTIYFCRKIEGDPTSGHFWVILYVDTNRVLYVTATSQVDRFMYKVPIVGDALEPARYAHPASAVFLAICDIVDGRKQQIFDRPTLLNCYNPLNEIPMSDFDDGEEEGLLKERGQLPNKYLAKIVPCARGGRWSNKQITMVLDKQYGIGEQVDDFYGQWW